MPHAEAAFCSPYRHYCHNRHSTPYYWRLYLSRTFPMPLTPEAIDACLPQTQCRRCGYPSCRAYAEAIASGAAGIEYCPPGGMPTLRGLAALLELPMPVRDPDSVSVSARQRAVIDELACIGCRKCIDVCPVDAILGARQLMHSVLDTECSGCELCLPACPVDCIALVPVSTPAHSDSLWPDYAHAEVERWRQRTAARLERLKKKLKTPRAARTTSAPATGERARIRAEIHAAVTRVRARKSARAKNKT